MSQKETTHLIGHLGDGESLKGDLPKLAELARQAFEQKRKKDCLDLTRAILLIDPDNAAALSMRCVIQSEMQRDLEDARALLRQAQSKENADGQWSPNDWRPPQETAPLETAAAVPLIPRRTSRVGLLMCASLLLVLRRFAAVQNQVESCRSVATDIERVRYFQPGDTGGGSAGACIHRTARYGARPIACASAGGKCLAS